MLTTHVRKTMHSFKTKTYLVDGGFNVRQRCHVALAMLTLRHLLIEHRFQFQHLQPLFLGFFAVAAFLFGCFLLHALTARNGIETFVFLGFFLFLHHRDVVLGVLHRVHLASKRTKNGVHIKKVVFTPGVGDKKANKKTASKFAGKPPKAISTYRSKSCRSLSARLRSLSSRLA